MNDIDIDKEDFKKLQSDVTEIKNALLGTEFNDNGVINRLKIAELDIKGGGEILDEVVRWKVEAQQWKTETTKKVQAFEQLKWKAAGIITALSIIVPVFWNYIKGKLGF